MEKNIQDLDNILIDTHQPLEKTTSEREIEGIIQGQSFPQNNSPPKNDLLCVKCGLGVVGHHVEALDQKYHRDCFVCAHCKDPIEQYVEKEGSAYCKPCYYAHFVKYKTCHECGQNITSDTVVSAFERDYHQECFKCGSCLEVIGSKYINREDQPYCSDVCFNKKIGKVCHTCSLPLPSDYLKVLGREYHSECFSCHVCQTIFPGTEFYPLENEPYCKQCAEEKTKNSK